MFSDEVSARSCHGRVVRDDVSEGAIFFFKKGCKGKAVEDQLSGTSCKGKMSGSSCQGRVVRGRCQGAVVRDEL